MKVKKILATLLSFVLVLSMLPVTVLATDLNDSSVFLKQPSGSKQCTLYSAAMMLRRRAILEGNDNWSSITPGAMYSAAWSGGLRWNFSYAGMKVTKAKFSGSVAEKKNRLISMLNSHPEGVEIYTYGDNVKWHAVLLLDYTGGVFYVADPAPGISHGRIPLTSAYFNGGSQDERIGWIKQIWYVTGGNCVIPAAPEPTPAQHTHNWSYGNETAHPHEQYRTCSCGAKEYTGQKSLTASCQGCYPLGNAGLTRSFDRLSGYTTFYRNSINNANSYSLNIMRSTSQFGTYSSYATVNMNSLSYSTTLPQGYYYKATLTAKNTNTSQIKSSTCGSFRIYNTYSVTYNANGGSGVPSNQTKIQDTDLTISSAKPTKAHYIFKGWSKNKSASEVSYASGGTYDKNAAITLYAVWEPETYIVSFDLNGGKGTADSINITYGDTAKMPNEIVKDSFYLKGWSKNSTSTNPEYKIGIDYAIDSNLKLYAVWGNATWSGDVAEKFAGGDGTQENPYQISKSFELAYLAKIVNSQSSAPEYKYYKLTDNINMGYEEWTPIGVYNNENQYFYGSFDGNGYTISDLAISNANEGYIGLFGKVQNSEIKNINIVGDVSGISSSSAIKAGALAGMAVDSSIHDCNAMYVNVSDISASAGEASSVACLVGNISGGEFKNNKANDCYVFLKTGKFDAGILAGYSGTDIEDCSVSSKEDELFGSNSTVGAFNFGGIVGYSANSIKKCSVKSAYLSNTIKTSKEISIGGIAGQSLGNIALCSAVFKDGASRTLDGEQRQISIYASGSGDQTIGGIVGTAKDSCAISDCKYNGQSIAGTTTNGNAEVGGLAGRAASSLNRSFAYTEGTVYANANKDAKSGGAVGNANCYTNSIKIGDYVQMGTYYGQPILWRCVAFEKIKGYSNGYPVIDSTDTRTTYADGYLPLMLSDKIICLKAFDAKGTNTSGSHGRGFYDYGQQGYYRRMSGSNYWADSNIRCWLNSTASAGNVYWACGNPPTAANVWNSYNAYDNEAGFLTNFTGDERNIIIPVERKSLLHVFEYSDSTNKIDKNYHEFNPDISNVVQNYSTASSINVADRIFLLDVKQINTVYNNRSLLGDDYYIGRPTKEAVDNSEFKDSSLTASNKWNSWLESPHAENFYDCYIRWVNSSGHIMYEGANYGLGGVRPALFLNPSSLNLIGEGTAENAYRLPTGDETVSGILSVSDRVSSVSSGSSYKAMSGDIKGSSSGFAFDNIYSNAGMDLSAVNSASSSNAKTETLGASKTLTQIKRESFLKTVFGPSTYKSLDYLNTDPTAVWVVKNGELPELYYNCLRNISISDKIENGAITLDKAQAIDGEAVTVTAAPDADYELNKIYVNGTEISGTSFEVDGETTVYAVFTQKPKTYTAKVEAADNAAASLLNADKTGEVMLMSASNEITATDGDEIKIDTYAENGYNIDAILVNGEEIAGESFVIDSDSEIELKVSSLNTDVSAITNDAENISDYFATVSGSVVSDDTNVSRYMRYWKESDPSTVYTTETETGAGDYSADIYPLEENTTYCYQMTELGEVKKFTTHESVPGPIVEEENVKPITSTTVKKLTSTYKFNITSEIELADEKVFVAVYSENGNLISVKSTTFDGDVESSVSIPKVSGISYAKVFVWKDNLVPLGGAELIDTGF